MSDASTRPTRFLITGANRGLGLELTRQALARGDRVLATCRDPDDAGELQELAERHPDSTKILPFDVTCGAAARRTLDALGDRALDVLVNNAGVYGGEHQEPGNMDYVAWQEAFSVNTMAPFRLTTALLPALRRSRRPRVVTLSSVMGSIGTSSTSSYAYSASKAAVNKVMRMLADALADEGIVVVPVHPGWVRTDMGGPEADLSTDESVTGLLSLIDRLGPEDSGRFWSWRGEELPW